MFKLLAIGSISVTVFSQEPVLYLQLALNAECAATDACNLQDGLSQTAFTSCLQSLGSECTLSGKFSPPETKKDACKAEGDKAPADTYSIDLADLWTFFPDTTTFDTFAVDSTKATKSAIVTGGEATDAKLDWVEYVCPAEATATNALPSDTTSITKTGIQIQPAFLESAREAKQSIVITSSTSVTSLSVAANDLFWTFAHKGTKSSSENPDDADTQADDTDSSGVAPNVVLSLTLVIPAMALYF